MALYSLFSAFRESEEGGENDGIGLCLQMFLP
jgi:hypothetical protein